MKQYNILSQIELLNIVFRLTSIIKAHIALVNKSIFEILKQLQGKGLINQLYRPIDSVMSMILPTPSINRSLPVTPIAGINTTPRVLTTEYSSLNGKLKSLESKIYGEIIAIKSFFTDELRLLKTDKQRDTNKE